MQKISPFLVLTEPDARPIGIAYLPGSYGFPGGPLPVIVEGVGCVGMARIRGVRLLADRTEVRFELVEDTHTGDADKLETYYHAYHYWKKDHPDG